MWRAVVALDHYRSSIAVANDPSIRELEQVSAGLEGGVSLILLLHGVASLALSRRPLLIRWPYALGVAVVCAVLVSGSLLAAPLITVAGVYPVSIVVSVLILSHFLMFGWLSLYLGALVGSMLGWYIAAPVSDALACLFVVGPCVVLAFLGAGLRFLYLRMFMAGSKS